jgi:hypothetical protein
MHREVTSHSQHHVESYRSHCEMGMVQKPRVFLNTRHQCQCDAPGLAFALFLLQFIDQIDRGMKAHPFALGGNAGHPNGGGRRMSS